MNNNYHSFVTQKLIIANVYWFVPDKKYFIIVTYLIYTTTY